DCSDYVPYGAVLARGVHPLQDNQHRAAAAGIKDLLRLLQGGKVLRQSLAAVILILEFISSRSGPLRQAELRAWFDYKTFSVELVRYSHYGGPTCFRAAT